MDRVSALSEPLLYTLKDEVTHFAFGIIVNLPLLLWYGAELLIPIFVFSVLLDIDHAVAARSFSIRKMMALPVRPAAHSITFAVAVGLFIFIVTGIPAYAWVSVTSMLSHVLADAGSSGETPIFWPFSDKMRIVRLHRIIGFAALFVATFGFTLLVTW